MKTGTECGKAYKSIWRKIQTYRNEKYVLEEKTKKMATVLRAYEKDLIQLRNEVNELEKEKTYFLKVITKEIKKRIKNDGMIPKISFDTWIEPLKIVELRRKIVVIQIPKDLAYAKGHIVGKYKNLFKVQISEYLWDNHEIMFVCEEDEP